MSFKVKSPKVTAPPEVPADPVAPQSQPTSDRRRRLATGGRQSTFLARMATAVMTGGSSITGTGG